MLNSLKIFLLSLSLIFTVGAIVLAQEAPPEVTEAVNLDEDVQPEDLGISEPRLLPDNPFYFLKNWARGIQQVLTFNPIKKAELRMKFANEKLMEVKKIVEKKKDPEVIKKATENYQQEVEKVKERVEKIEEKAKENPQVESFLDKFIQQETLHQKLLERLKTQVPSEAYEKIEEARNKHLERFNDVMLKLEDRKEVITEKLDKVLEEQKGSQFKEFKNLEILKNLEEKVPEEAKSAIQKAQENALKRLQGDLEKMSPEDQEKFGEYIEKTSGDKEKQLEILENLKSELKAIPVPPTILEKLEQGKTKIFEKIEEKLEKTGCTPWPPMPPDFCKEGRVIIEKDPETGCPLPPKCVIPGEIGCETFITCEEGYIPVDTGERDSAGCPIRKCVKKEEAEKPVEVCITLWDPVCGKDGKTYTNACFAQLAGVEIDYKDECRKKECQTDADCPQLRCGPAGTVSAKCIGVTTKCIEGKCVIQPVIISPPEKQTPAEIKPIQ